MMIKTCSYPPEAKYLIIHADDWGIHPAVNEAVQILFRMKAITSASIIAGGPASAEACRYAAETGVCAGVHLALSSEFPPLSPLEQIPSLLTGNEEFHPLPILEEKAVHNEIFRELLTQLEYVADWGIAVSHLDCHKGCVLGLNSSRSNPWLDFVWQMCADRHIPFKLPRGIMHAPGFSDSFRQRMKGHWAKAVNLGLPLIDDLIVPPFQLLPGEDYPAYKEQILHALRRITAGTVVELTLHPALPDHLLKDTDSHWIKREWEFRLCLDADFRGTIRSEGIRLIPWKRP
ncbi:MAG: hypothetical protein K0R57_4450 [Paenibacillaceae bacterium]|jgi:predicted glycoside hydrolase/deacetylase ChbG (UPF0249 family)|nr:hypothetical protein [Paenibacillaceae bacterium]